MIHVKLIKPYISVTIFGADRFLNNFHSTGQDIFIQIVITFYICLQTPDHLPIWLDCYYSPHAFDLSDV